MTRPSRRPERQGCLPVLVSLVTLMVVALVLVGVAQCGVQQAKPYLVPSQCIATTSSGTVSVTHEQAGNAAIIAGVAVRQDLGDRGAMIGLVTALQESGLRNLDHGDRDSLGLFQQRPSQGWGTPAEIMNPWTSTERFYAAMVKIDGWRTDDPNDVAQQVQHSGVPDGYRKHIGAATQLAAALAGDEPATFSCLDRDQNAGDPASLAEEIANTYHLDSQVDGRTITVHTGSQPAAWSVGSFAVARTQALGVVGVQVGDKSWALATDKVAEWGPAATSRAATDVVITLR